MLTPRFVRYLVRYSAGYKNEVGPLTLMIIHFLEDKRNVCSAKCATLWSVHFLAYTFVVFSFLPHQRWIPPLSFFFFPKLPRTCPPQNFRTRYFVSAKYSLHSSNSSKPLVLATYTSPTKTHTNVHMFKHMLYLYSRHFLELT